MYLPLLEAASLHKRQSDGNIGVTINGSTFHVRFKCSVEDRNQRLELVSGQSGHRTSFRRIFNNGSTFAHRVSLHFSSYENSIPLNLDEV